MVNAGTLLLFVVLVIIYAIMCIMERIYRNCVGIKQGLFKVINKLIAKIKTE